MINLTGKVTEETEIRVGGVAQWYSTCMGKTLGPFPSTTKKKRKERKNKIKEQGKEEEGKGKKENGD